MKTVKILRIPSRKPQRCDENTHIVELEKPQVRLSLRDSQTYGLIYNDQTDVCQ
jgi:hypothetical protein